MQIFLVVFFIFYAGMPIFGDNGENIPKLSKISFKTQKSNIWVKYEEKRIFPVFNA